MKPGNYLSGSKVGLFTLLLLFASFASAQTKRPPNPLESFLDTQFWLGLRIGTNVTQANPTERFSGFSPIDYGSDTLNKQYEDFTLPGAHLGLEMNYYHRGFSVSFQPGIKRSRYSYSNSFEWIGENPNSRFETEYDIEQRLDLVELPLFVKYDVIQTGSFRPFVMVGGFHNFVISASKRVDITQTDYSSGNPLSTSGGVATLGVKDDFQGFSGVAGGAGVNLDYWNIRTVFEVSYRYSLSSATRPNTQQEELAAIGDANDELRLNDMSISLAFVFPFRFIDQQFKAN